MRITQNLKFATYAQDIARRQEDIFNANRQLSTGKKVIVPSDDPVNAAGILRTRGVLNESEQYKKNIDNTLSYLSVAEKSVASAKEILERIQELAVGQATGTTSPQARAQSAEVIDELFNEMVALGNTNYDNRYIFSGYEFSTTTFDSAGAYQGDTNSNQVQIGPGKTMTYGVNGGEVFKGVGGGTDIFTVVSDLVTALRANDTASIKSSLTGLEDSYNQLSDHQGEIGARIIRLNTARDMLDSTSFELEITLSKYEDADITEAITDLRVSQSALEAVLTSAGRVFDVNIFNYL